MSNKVTATDLNFFSIALNEISNELDSEQFAELMDIIVDAKDKGKLSEMLSQASFMVEEGTDLVSSFHYAHFDLVAGTGENF